ncbi:MAG: hypothetical protein GVY17_05565, partial [Cyanobacteria bacterium]|nr:hypothetical protein [Cyanobacteria bacterium GSL.Bin21]
MTYSLEQLEEITTLNPAHQQAVEALLGFYQFVRSTWTANAIAQLKQAHDLDLRRKQDRLQLAHFAARRELDFAKSLPEGLQPVAHLPEENYYQPATATAEVETDTESASERYAR